MQTVESLVVWVGVRDMSCTGRVSQSRGLCQPGWEAHGAAGAWAQVAPGCLHRDQRAQGAWAWHPFPLGALSSAMEVPTPIHRLLENGGLFAEVGSWVVVSDILSTGQQGCH